MRQLMELLSPTLGIQITDMCVRRDSEEFRVFSVDNGNVDGKVHILQLKII